MAEISERKGVAWRKNTRKIEGAAAHSKVHNGYRIKGIRTIRCSVAILDKRVIACGELAVTACQIFASTKHESATRTSGHWIPKIHQGCPTERQKKLVCNYKIAGQCGDRVSGRLILRSTVHAEAKDAWITVQNVTKTMKESPLNHAPGGEQPLWLPRILVALKTARSDADTRTAWELRHDVGHPAVATEAAVTVKVQALV